MNNESYAAVGAAIRRYRGDLKPAERKLAVDLAGPRIAEIAAGFGVDAHRVTERGELGALLKETPTNAAPMVIEVMTDPLDLGP